MNRYQQERRQRELDRAIAIGQAMYENDRFYREYNGPSRGSRSDSEGLVSLEIELELDRSIRDDC